MAITDLTGTTWYVPSGSSPPSSALTVYINGNVNGDDALYFEKIILSALGKIIFYDPVGEEVCRFTTDEEFSVSFVSGDVTKADLIQWLETYGERINGGNSGNSAKIITFTINGQEYLAEEGMTFADWSDTVYNTSDYVADASMNKVTNYANVLGGVTCDTVIVQGASYSADLGGY